jgi:nucleoside-diphosphate-sugar epimerase
MKQAILGATGNIGNLLLEELTRQNIHVKALARHWNEAFTTDAVEHVSVAAEDVTALKAVTTDISVLYVTLAIPYDTAAWQQSWPIVMQNVITASKTNGFKIVFLDNVYMYGRVEGPMTEESPVHPVAKKGVVRAHIAQMLLDAIEAKEVTAVLARSADFYGPHTRISDGFFNGAYNNGIATWIGDPNALRTWSYTLDNAKALAILGNDARADNQIWHMPAATAMKGTAFVTLTSELLGKELQTVPFPGPDANARADFEQKMPEIAEMMYQYDYDYVFDSTKFQQTFAMKPTSYKEGFMHIFNQLAQK